MFRDRLRIEKRFECRAGLTQRGHAIDLCRGRQYAGGTDPCEDVTARIVDHDDRAVLHVARAAGRAQFAQRLLQRRNCHALKIHVERAGDRRARRRTACAEDAAREVRSEIDGVARRHHAGGSREHKLRVAVQTVAVRALPHVAKNAASPLGNPGDRRIRRAQQRHGECRFARIEPAGQLAEERLRHRRDTNEFPAKRHEVEVGLQNLVLAPALLQPQGRCGLPDLLRDGTIARAGTQIVVEQAGELHRQRGRAARARVPEIAPGCCGHPAPVHATVLVEALVFRDDQRLTKGGRDVGERDPVATLRLHVRAQALQGLPPAIEQNPIRGTPVVTHFVKRRHRPRRRRRVQQSERERNAQHHMTRGATAAPLRPRPHSLHPLSFVSCGNFRCAWYGNRGVRTAMMPATSSSCASP